MKNTTITKANGQLASAIEEAELTALKEALKAGADIHHKDTKERTMLYLACGHYVMQTDRERKYAYKELITYLLETTPIDSNAPSLKRNLTPTGFHRNGRILIKIRRT